MVELADTYDLGSYVARHAGSSPVARTISSVHNGLKLWTLDFYALMYEQAVCLLIFLCALGDILNCHAFAGVGGVVVTVIRDLNDTHEFVVDHNALGAVLAGAFRFVHINMVD